MNEEKIEELLRKAPGAPAPAGLLQRLQRDVRLPRPDTNANRGFQEPSWARRWMPALSFAVFLVACVVVVAVQGNTLAGLKRENDGLRAAGQNLEQLRTENADYKRLLADSQELDRLRRDKAELEKLRTEVAALRAQAADTDKLRADNQTLQSQIAAAASSDPKNNFFAREEERAERIQCVNNLKQIGLSIRTWAADNNGAFSPDFISMTNELWNPLILQCPSDKSRNISGWTDVAKGNVSYQYFAAGGKDSDDPQNVAAVCPIHHNYGLFDGSVQMLSPEAVQKYIKTVNGRLMMVR